MTELPTSQSLTPKPELKADFWFWAFGFGLWVLGLTRYLAEALYLYPLFSSSLVVVGVTLAGAGLALAFWRAFPAALRPRLACAWPALLLPLAYVLAPRPDPLVGLALLAGGLALAGLQLALLPHPSPPNLGRRGGVGEELGGQKASLPRSRWMVPALLALTVFGLYLRTLGQTVGEADTFEFQVVAPTLGIAHPTGYPLYTLLGKVFSLLPLGPVAWRVNLTSAVFATGAVVLFYFLLQRLTREPLVPLLSALTLAFSRVFWSQAVVAAVYALNLLFVTGALFLAVILLDGQAGGGQAAHRPPKRNALVCGLALLLGLALTNHPTMLLLLPSLGLALLLSRPRMGWRWWWGAAALFLLGLVVYAYVPLRWPALHDGRWMGAGEFLAYVTGLQFGGALQVGFLRDPTRYAILGRLLLEPFGWVGVALAALGLGWLAARRLRLALVSVLALLPYCLYGLVYLLPDVSVFLLPTQLLLALWMGVGIAALARLARRLSAWTPCLLVALFALLPLSRIWLNLPVVDQSGRVEAERWGRAVLDLPLAQGAAILADGEKFAPLYYFQQIEGRRPDLDLVVHFAAEECRADLLARLEAGQTVYLARYLPHLEEYFLRSLGPLVEVGTAPLVEPPPRTTPVGAVFGAEMELLACDLQDDQHGRPLRHLTLYWQADAVPWDDLEVRLRLVDGTGEVAWTSAGSRPVGGNYPTNAWLPGTVVPDYHALPVEPWLAPDRYALQVALFPRFSDQGLAVEGGLEEGWLTLAEVAVERDGIPPGILPYSYRATFGPIWLVGYDLPETVPAGSLVPVDLAWVGVERETRGRLEWLDEVGGMVAGMDLLLAAGTVRSRHVVTAPATAETYRLRVRLEGVGARCHWLAPRTTACELATVQVTPALEGLADFDGRIWLAGAEAGAGSLRCH